ncbi:profilin, required for normal timing of actin polymerization in response to thermal stress [Mortierella sp. AM989]|nr:profilin, required for normal timing of actin polymerization in response to thermal stress [Mortierella sp. AM989]
MTWESQIDELTGTGKVLAAAFYGHKGDILATSPGVTVGPTEVEKLVAAFNDDSDAISNGLYLEGTKFQYINNKDGVLQARDKESKSGMVCVLTKQSILVGFCEDDRIDNCLEAVKKTGDSLRALGK